MKKRMSKLLLLFFCAALLLMGLLAGCGEQRKLQKGHGERGDPFGILCAAVCGNRAGLFEEEDWSWN